ncbi:electron transfer flavoprotein subunit alpha/FixB family protein [Pseudomonas sp. H11T01]|uniref:electron transfer flavoprotein subunit alpha/FixB family protein n=1 Tax=Pseudomonas sp. H11T01 TaxID=3402749 RepID=UPI003AC64257
MSRLLALIPQAWGDEALDAALAAVQSVAVNEEFAVVLLGAEPASHAAERAARAGAKQVYHAFHAELASCEEPAVLAVAASEALRAIPVFASGVSLVLLPPGPVGEEFCALLADKLNGRALGRCIALSRDGDMLLAERSCWGGRMRVMLQVEEGPAFACLRAGRPHLSGPVATDVYTLALHAALPQALTLERRKSGQHLPPLDGARLIVSGGRGVNETGFNLLETLAVAWGGTLGGSLPAVDAGMVPVLRQVGISGKYVSPDIYLAVGISGTAQHLAGVSLESRIVAINKDAHADIFKVATLGIIGDWETLLPALLAETRNA